MAQATTRAAGERTWNGVAILSRWEPIVTQERLPGTRMTSRAGTSRPP